MIMAFGYAFEPGPGPMRIFRLNATSSPEQILSEETFQLTDVRKGASGRSLLVIGRRSFSQRSGECLSTYDPYAVFKVTDEAKGRFEYALALSKEYNLAHYAGWAGPDSDERIPVDICRNRIRIIRP